MTQRSRVANQNHTIIRIKRTVCLKMRTIKLHAVRSGVTGEEGWELVELGEEEGGEGKGCLSESVERTKRLKDADGLG